MLEPTSAVQRKLRNWQTQLLDLSRANRLLYFKVERASTVPLVRPAPDDFPDVRATLERWRALGPQGRAMPDTPVRWLAAKGGDPARSCLKSLERSPAAAYPFAAPLRRSFR